MRGRSEIDVGSARAYLAASKKDKGRILSEVMSLTGWSRDTARRRLVGAAEEPAAPGQMAQRLRASKYSFEARRLLRWVWRVSGEQCGKYLAVSMPLVLAGLERHGELVEGERGYTATVRDELLSMSAATIDRYLQQMRLNGHLGVVSRTEASALSRSWSTRVRAVDQADAEPGYFTAEVIHHCGVDASHPARTLILTDLHTGWTFTRTVPGTFSDHVLEVLDVAVGTIPFAVVAVELDNRIELVDATVLDWARRRGIEILHLPDGDPATAVRNSDVTRRCGYPYCFDSEAERQILNSKWALINERLNHLTPNRKPSGWEQDGAGRRRRAYDTPATPVDRLLAAGVISPAQEAQLIASRERLNPAAIDHRINELLTRRRLQAGHRHSPTRSRTREMSSSP